jgi:hypothetical protein
MISTRGLLISGCALSLALTNGCGRTTGLGPTSSGGAGGVLVTGGAGGVLVTGGAGGVPAFFGTTATGGQGGTGGIGGMPGPGGTTATGGQTTCSPTEPCAQGLCVGASCGDTWTCVVDGRDCAGTLVDYCGCDGVIFQDSWACPTRPYSYPGACPPVLANCDQRAVACELLPPTCGPGQFPRVVGSCWDGTCVPISQCQCTVTEECPEPGNFVCYTSKQHCDSLMP